MQQQLLETLNPRQYEAVVHGDGPLLVLAGAGSGKTRVLTHRVAHLIHARGVPPHRVLAFTFTNRAAREMRDRIERLIGAFDGLWVGTFHAICVRILRRHADRVGRTSSFTIYDADDQRAVVKHCIRDQGHSDKELKPQVVHAVISQAKNRLEGPAALEARAHDDARTDFLLNVAGIFREYERRLRDANAFDFDDLIGCTIEVMRDHPEVREHYAERFMHVLVDEYQDTNRAQYLLITQLASRHRNLAVVGDDDQSIYSWRGADIQNILSFEQSYPDAVVIRLEQNYRSTRTILRAANTVVRNNRGRKPKELWTDNDEGEAIRFWLLGDEETEAESVVGEMQAASERGEVDLRDCVVLYRTHAQSRPLEGALRRRGMHYDIIGGVSFYERREVKDMLAYLRLVASPRDDVSVLRILNVPKRGIGQTTVDRLVRWARATGVPLDEACRHREEIPGLAAAAVRRLDGFTALIDGLRARRDLSIPALLQALIEDTGYLQHLESDDPLTAEGRRENLDELAAAAAHYEASQSEHSLDGFLAEVALVSEVDAFEEAAERVTLMTAHNAKGLEFDLVVVAGLEQGLFPHASSFEDMQEMEEERRLFYVALTRARKRVILTAARRRWRYGASTESAVSEFVSELPAADLEVIDLSGYDGARSRGRDRRPAGGGGAGRSQRTRGFAGAAIGGASADAVVSAEPSDAEGAESVQFDPSEGWRNMVGEPVMHAQFGRGTVVGQEGYGPDARLTVRFDGAVTKKLLARYLSLIE